MDSMFKRMTTWLVLLLGVVLGVLIYGGLRVATYAAPEETHYHANFAVFINGQQEQFKDPGYYEETEMCTKAGVKTPAERAHMHDDVNNVVHVEDTAVTWGQFFENLGWSVSDGLIKTPDAIYSNNDSSKVSFILNGQAVSGINRTVIKDQDRLLISYGDSNQTELLKQYQSVPATAHKYDVTKDPKSCSGHGDGRPTMMDRMKHGFEL